MTDSFRTILVPAPLVERVRALAANWPGALARLGLSLTVETDE